MEPKKPPANDIYLTKDEVSKLLVGLNFSMEKHYSAYDAELPGDLVLLTNRMMEMHNSFKYCYNCRVEWVQRWSQDEHNCPAPKGEEE